MTMTKSSNFRDGSQKLDFVNALRFLAMSDTRDTMTKEQPPLISAFVTRRRESIAALAMPMAGLVIVIEGRKEVRIGVDLHVYGKGDAFILPTDARVDVVNEPDSRTGFYRALFVCFPRELMVEAARLWPQFVRRDVCTREPVINADLCSAILHCAETLSRRLLASRHVKDHRVLEILLILAEQGALSLTPKYVNKSVAEAVLLLIRHRLHLPWKVATVAAELSMSEATLRRRLRAEAHTFQELLRAERMKAAYIVLNDRDADVADALAATGYQSRSHFARHFQKQYGVTPSSIRYRKQSVRSS